MSTLAALRQKLGDRLNFRQAGAVTAVGVKGLAGFVDVGVTDPDDVLRGSWVLFTSGTAGNLGKSFRVAGNRAGEILLATPLAVAAAASDGYELFRRFSPTNVRDAINVAIRDAYPELYLRVEQEVAEDITTLEYAYPSMIPFDLRQLRRRTNVSSTPPTYVELPGQIWEDLGQYVRLRYRPAAGQFIQFVGITQQPELVADTDNTVLPDELIIAGAAQNLNENLQAGEAGSDVDFYDREAKKWALAFLNAKRKYTYAPIPRERHPPMIRIAAGPAGLLGPINPAP